MAHLSADLYSILVSYSNRNNSPHIAIEPFISFLQKYAQRVSQTQPDWKRWQTDTRVKFWNEVNALAQEGKCEILSDVQERRIFMPQFYQGLLKKVYQNPDKIVDIPFPNEESLKISLSQAHTRILNLDIEFLNFLENPQEEDYPIIKLIFPDEFGTALVLASMIPRQLVEISLLKVRDYLLKHNNRDFFQHKLGPQLPGKESFLKDIFEQIMTRPMDVANSLLGGGELSFLFWAYFSSLVKGDIRKKKELLAEDKAVVQGLLIIEPVNGYCKNQANKAKDRDLAFKNLEQLLEKLPYNYTLDAICKFTNSKGVLLLGQYSNTELENWLKTKTTEIVDGELPSLVIVKNPLGENWYILKGNVHLLCNRLLGEGRIAVRDAISKRWRKILEDYHKEPAMDNDADFERLLARLISSHAPGFMSLIADIKLPLIWHEMEKFPDKVPEIPRLFFNGKLLPYSEILLFDRREILSSIRLLLPFWYSLPLIIFIISFFNGLGRKKTKKNEDDSGEEKISGEEKEPARVEAKKSLQNCQRILIPLGYTMDSYLSELESRWSKLLDKQARVNLVEDVKSLVRDYVRRVSRVNRHPKFTIESLGEMTDSIIARNSTLQKMNDQDALNLCIKLYLIKLFDKIIH